MDLALTQSIIKSPSHSSHHHHQQLNRTNSQQIISTTFKKLHQSPQQTQIPLIELQQNEENNHKNEAQQQKLATTSNRKYYFGASKTIMNLLKTNDNKIDEELEELYRFDSVQLTRQVKSLLHDINEHLNLTLNGTALDNKKPNQVVIYVCIVFLKIGEIDTVKERFQADAYIETHWDDDTVDPKLAFDPRNHWNPELHIENAIGELKQEIRYKTRNINGKCRVYEMRNVKGVFWERLELWDFPLGKKKEFFYQKNLLLKNLYLDIQELSITLSTSRSEKEITFEQNPDHPCTVNTQDFLNQQEWNIFTHVTTSTKTIKDLWNNCKRPCFSSTAFVSRKPGYFIYNAYMLIFFVSTLGFVPFSFTVANNHFRIQVTSLLILTSVNFRWIVTQRLPTVSYLTTLDKYAIGALIFLVALCGWHATIGSSVIYDNDTDNKERVDTIVLVVIGVFYIIYHIIYFTFFYYKYRKYDTIGKQAKYEEFQSNNMSAANSHSVNSVNASSVYNNNNSSSADGSSIMKRKNTKPGLTPVEEARIMKNFNYNSNMKTIAESVSTIDVPNSITENSCVK
jgi:hypothetical protein